jgi:glycosyltransferase involved in cell wall biosynthesis
MSVAPDIVVSTEWSKHSPSSLAIRPLRVLQVFHTLGVGGAEVWLIALLRQLAALRESTGIDVRFDICLTGGIASELDEEARALGARLIYLRYDRTHVFSFIRKFRSLLREGHYDALHDHQGHPAGLRLLFALGILPPVRVVHFHNPTLMLDNYSSSMLRRCTVAAGNSAIGWFATHLLGTSRQILSEHGFSLSSGEKRPFADALYCGFDVRRFEGDRQVARDALCRELSFQGSVKLMLFAGRLNSHADLRRNQKNPAFALDVAMECVRRDESVRFLVAGGGDVVRQNLERQMSDAGFADTIRFLGVRTDVPKLMLASDLLLFPSLAEGLGMVAVEAQATGLRVLASDSTPREAAVIPELCTFLPLASGISAWASEAIRLLALPHADARASNNFVATSRFAIARSTAELLSVYATGGPVPVEVASV